MTDLWGQIPRAAPKANVEKLLAKEREAAIKRELEKSKQYKLVESDEESPPKKVIKKEKNESDSDDEEKKRVSDLKERDEFAERLKKKDKESQRNVISATKSSSEAEKRRQLEAGGKEVIDRLRIESRRQYLKKREDDKLLELEADIMDDEYLFEESQLTEKERHDREYKKKILLLAKEHKKAGDIEKAQRYTMPDDVKVRSKTVPDKYVELDEREKQPHSEQRVWEDARMATAQWSFGARDARQKLKEKGKLKEDYDLLLEDQIDFVQMTQLEGTKGNLLHHLKYSRIFFY